jgi:hypothetical protein
MTGIVGQGVKPSSGPTRASLRVCPHPGTPAVGKQESVGDRHPAVAGPPYSGNLQWAITIETPLVSCL